MPPAWTKKGGNTVPALPSITACLLRQRKHLQDAGVLRHALPRLAKCIAVAVADERTPAGHHRHILLALGQIRDDAALAALAIVVLPQLLAVGCVIRGQHAIGFERTIRRRRCSTD